MINIERLKNILGRKVELNNGKRDIDINIGEISRELGCSKEKVVSLLYTLQGAKEIKRLIPMGFSKEEYTLTVLANSSILMD